jgi:hypothetical protein
MKYQEEALMNIVEVQTEDPINAPPTEQDDPRYTCRGCRGPTRPVTRKTVLLMLKPALLDHAEEGEYRFCAAPECRVVYFTEDDGISFRTDDLRVRVGFKERLDPIPLCYCFGYEESEAREEIRKTGASTIPQRITALIQQKMCACPARNPSGACCLGDAKTAIKKFMVVVSE